MERTKEIGLGAYKSSALAGVMALAFSVALAPAAHADTIYPSTDGLCCFSVDLHQTDSTDVFVTVSLTGGATLFASTGNPFPTNHPGFGFNLAGPAITSANILSPTNLSTFHVGSDTTSPDFGKFAYYFDIPGTGTSGNDAGPLTFTVSRATGVLVTDFNANTAGYLFVADILNARGATGLSAVSAVPEPISSALVGTGLLSLFLLRRRQTR